MGSPLFLGAEPEDFTLTFAWSRQGAIRTGSYSRGAMTCTTDGHSAIGSFAAATTLGACACFGIGSCYTSATPRSIPFFGLGTGGVTQIGLNYTNGTGVMNLLSWNGAAYDTLDTHTMLSDAATKFDMYVEDYGTANCRVRVWAAYVNSYDPSPQLIFDTTGDYGDSANLDEIILCTPWWSASRMSFDEVIVHEDPTLRMRLATLTPNGAGSGTNWTGAYTDIDETTASDQDNIESATNDAIFNCELSSLPTSNETVLAAQAVARASKGLTGLANIQVGLNSNGTETFTGDQALDIGFAGYQGDIVEADPDTAAAWLRAAINSLKWTVKART